MKRAILGLVMISSFALAAAPMAHAAALGECGKSYAFQVRGDEPITSNNAELAYITGVGTITFGAVNGTGNPNPTGCSVTNLELIYNDNDVNGTTSFYAGPNHCYDANSVTSSGIPCFDGADHEAVTGILSPSTDGHNAATLAIAPSFSWVDTEIVAAALPLQFTLNANTGSSTIIGNSVSLPGPSLPTGTPPQNPVLTITMQAQATAAVVTLPVSGPLATSGCGSFGCTGGGNDGYGTKPYVGLSVNSFDGVGAQVPQDGFAQPIGGSFGTSTGQLQIFSSGQAGGSASFNNNDNVGNTTGATNDSCDTLVSQTGNFADGASNVDASIAHPSLNCADAFVGGTFQLSSVVWGATDTSAYNIVTGIAAATLTGGETVPPGQMSSGESLSSVPAGTITNLVVPQTITAINKTATGYIKMTNTSPAGCDVTATLPSATSGTCSLSESSFPALVNGSPVSFVVEGDTPSTQYVQTNCTCTGTSGSTVSSPLTITSTDCPLSGTTSYTITCKN
jgi:hypothetical protein